MSGDDSFAQSWIAGMPNMDIWGLSDEWALAVAGEGAWALLARDLGTAPAQWRDGAGDRMYAAIMAAWTEYDLDAPIREDDRFQSVTTMPGVRKPHGLSETRFEVDGQCRVKITLLTSFVRRETAGSNKKFSRVRDIWNVGDRQAETVDAALEAHHLAKSREAAVQPVLRHEVNKARDFNNALLLYFRNFVGIAKAAEWKANLGEPARRSATRQSFYFGNVDDGETIIAQVGREADLTHTVLVAETGQRLFFSAAETPVLKPEIFGQ
jgi:probable biosynthetic protein (TIGR04098 family)